MMLKQLLFGATLLTLVASCGQKAANASDAKEQTQNFGEKINTKGAISFSELGSKMAGTDSLAVKVRGSVESVCQVKGCWMNMQDAKAGNMFVQFKDYGFFMPKDISGREVIIEGYAYRKVTPVDELRHYAEDAGKTQEEIEAITEPKEELKFMASGVLLLPESKK